jgi:hypothetical protein
MRMESSSYSKLTAYAPKDQSNRRSHLPGYAAWEIHPVMKLTVQ